MSSRSSDISTEFGRRRSGANADRFLLCLSNAGYEASLEPRKLYLALPDRDAASHGQVRVIDESGEDYLFPASLFASVTLSASLRRLLRRAV